MLRYLQDGTGLIEPFLACALLAFLIFARRRDDYESGSTVWHGHVQASAGVCVTPEQVGGYDNRNMKLNQLVQLASVSVAKHARISISVSLLFYLMSAHGDSLASGSGNGDTWECTEYRTYVNQDRNELDILQCPAAAGRLAAKLGTN
jgi:hypothetical protein